MTVQNVRVTGFLNSDSAESSLARLGGAALSSGVGEAALRALVALTCQAHSIPVGGLHCRIDGVLLDELAGIALVYRSGENEIKLV